MSKHLSHGRLRKINETRRKAAIQRAYKLLKGACNDSDEVKMKFFKKFEDAVHMYDPIYHRMINLEERDLYMAFEGETL